MSKPLTPLEADLLAALKQLTTAVNYRAAAVAGGTDDQVQFSVEAFWRAQDEALDAIAKAEKS
ncbi:hypothetical protein [Methylibium sp. T29]|uniref:hypothetical protein n=1 Tax=Methylibium sp. T29 TaxID=1430884 RepID=UPI0003F3FFFC|nr:hypothetical protein [Methylibium sp. T29]EWS53325.1 hypothetical protein X551_03898 [Methylibium sp. T29]